MSFILCRQLTGQYGAFEALPLQPPHLVGRPRVALRAGVEADGQMLFADEAEESHVLHEQRVDAYRRQPPDESHGLVELLVVDDGIDGDVDLCAKLMGIVAKARYVVGTVACRRPCSEM